MNLNIIIPDGLASWVMSEVARRAMHTPGFNRSLLVREALVKMKEYVEKEQQIIPVSDSRKGRKAGGNKKTQ